MLDKDHKLDYAEKISGRTEVGEICGRRYKQSEGGEEFDDRSK